MRTAVLWDDVPGSATGEVLSWRNAKQPARTSENQANVKSAGRQTIAITTPLSMVLASSLESPLTPAYTKRRGVSPSSCETGGESQTGPGTKTHWAFRHVPAINSAPLAVPI